MDKKNNKNERFLQETLSNDLFPDRIASDQANAFKALAAKDFTHKQLASKGKVLSGSTQNIDNKLVSEDGTIHEPNWAIMVATSVEFEACLSYFRECKFNIISVELGSTKLGGRIVEYLYEKQGLSIESKIYVQRTDEQGSNSSSNLSQRICSLNPAPNVCFLVGSCGALPEKKLKLLDVLVPTLAVDGQKYSLKNKQIIPEPGTPFTRHAQISNALTGFENIDFELPDNCRVETAKQLFTSIGKWDTLGNKLTDALLTSDENIVAVEMEGVGLVDGLKLAQESEKQIKFGISKSAADYCSTDELNEKQLSDLKQSMPEIELDSVKPTSNPDTKLLLQREATIRALRVALKISQKL